MTMGLKVSCQSRYGLQLLALVSCPLAASLPSPYEFKIIISVYIERLHAPYFVAYISDIQSLCPSRWLAMDNKSLRFPIMSQ